MVEIPPRIRGRDDSAELRDERVEDVAPVYIPPHLLCNERDLGAGGEVVGKASMPRSGRQMQMGTSTVSAGDERRADDAE